MAFILGLETSTDVCSVSLSEDGKEIAVKESVSGNDHARTLAVLIESILADHELEPAMLSAVAVSCGPGSYTGLRIGVSTAKGLCYGLRIPLISVGSLYSLANTAVRQSGGFPEGTVLCPMIDARRMEVYSQLYDTCLQPMGEVEASIITGESFAREIDRSTGFIIFGNGASKCRTVLSYEKVLYLDVRPSAAGLVTPAWAAFEKKQFEDAAYFEPFYLKDFVITESKKKFF